MRTIVDLALVPGISFLLSFHMGETEVKVFSPVHILTIASLMMEFACEYTCTVSFQTFRKYNRRQTISIRCKEDNYD